MTTKTTGSKTPYEIRLELLKMAKDHLESSFKAQTDFATQMALALIAANKVSTEELSKYAPKMYTFEDIAKKAAELYTFVQKKD